MPTPALDDQRFERIAPTWEVGRPQSPRPTPSSPSDRWTHITVAIGVALAALIATAAITAAVAGYALGLPMGGGVGQRTPHPQAAADLAGGFELAAGDLRLDLRDVALPAGTTRTKVEVGFGSARVVVPRGVEVVVDGHVVGGQVDAFGRREDGLDVDTTQSVAGAGPHAPRLVLDARVGFGKLTVVRG